MKRGLSSSQVIKPGEAPLYNGVTDTARKIVARDGFVGLYRGMAAPIVGGIQDAPTLLFLQEVFFSENSFFCFQ